MTGTPNQSFCGVVGEYRDHISFGYSGTTDKVKLCDLMKNQWSTYKRVTFMNKLSKDWPKTELLGIFIWNRYAE